MSVEASGGKIQHQPIYSFTYSLARSGSVLPERSCAPLRSATLPQNKCCVFYGDTWAFYVRGTGDIGVNQARTGKAAQQSHFFFFSPAGFLKQPQSVNKPGKWTMQKKKKMCVNIWRCVLCECCFAVWQSTTKPKPKGCLSKMTNEHYETNFDDLYDDYTVCHLYGYGLVSCGRLQSEKL